MGSADGEALGAPEGIGEAGGNRAWQGGDGGNPLPRDTVERPRREPSDFDTECLIGQGSAALVYLVRCKRTRRMSALKVQRKVDHARCAERVQMEREVMVDARHPLVAPLYCAFQDRMYLYLNMEYCPGGSLDNYVRYFVKRTLTEDETRFYAAEITSGLEFLHSKGYVYRDLKAANVLVAASGHIKLTDFGIVERGKVKIETEDKIHPDSSMPETPSMPRTRSSPGLRQAMPAALKHLPQALAGRRPFEPKPATPGAGAAACRAASPHQHSHASVPRTHSQRIVPSSHRRAATTTGVCSGSLGQTTDGGSDQRGSTAVAPGVAQEFIEPSCSSMTPLSSFLCRKQAPTTALSETPPRPPTLRSRLRDRLMLSPLQPRAAVRSASHADLSSLPACAPPTASATEVAQTVTTTAAAVRDRGVEEVPSSSSHHKRNCYAGGDVMSRVYRDPGLPPSGAEGSSGRDATRDRTRNPPLRVDEVSATRHTTVTLSEASWCVLSGSPEYMAPEVLMHAAQGSAVDWWGLGVLAYELLFGRTPFVGEGGKTRQTYLNIMHKEAQFPSSVGGEPEDGSENGNFDVSSTCQNFIRALLVKDPRGRAGSRGTHAVKAHPFFASIRWDQLQSQEPPLLPKRLGVVGTDSDATPSPPPVHNTSGWAWAAEDAFGEVGKGERGDAGGNDELFGRFDWSSGDGESEKHPGQVPRVADGLGVERQGLTRGDQLSRSIRAGAAMTATVAKASMGAFRPPAEALIGVGISKRAPVF